MIAALIFSLTLFGVLVALAAWIMERACIRLGLTRRWTWLAAMLLMSAAPLLPNGVWTRVPIVTPSSRSAVASQPSPNPVVSVPHADRGWSFHRWFVYVGEGETLIFEPKTSHTIDEFCDCRHAQFIKRVYQSVGDLNRIHRVLPRECNYTVLRWANEFKFAVKNPAGDRPGC